MHLDYIYLLACGDLGDIPDAFVDIVITSPPYNLAYRTQRRKKHNMPGYDGFTDSIPQDQYEAEQISLLNACCRVLKPGGSIFYNHKERHIDGIAISPHRWVLQADCELVATIIWDRKSTHNVDPRRLYATEEYIYHLRKPGHRPSLNPRCASWTKIWRMPFHETRKNAHPAPFPVELPHRCIQLCAPPEGAVVLDPYMGSGSTAVAAILTGHHYIGYEISARYIRIAERRITQARIERRVWNEAQGNQNGKSAGKPSSNMRARHGDIFAD